METRKRGSGDTRGMKYHYMNEYAYPLNTIEKPQIMRRLLDFGKSRGVYGLGRWGEHVHYNSDAVVGACH